MMARCSSCRFFEKILEWYQQPPRGNVELDMSCVSGRCWRASPPSARQQHMSDGRAVTGAFWCGQYEQRTPQWNSRRRKAGWTEQP